MPPRTRPACRLAFAWSCVIVVAFAAVGCNRDTAEPQPTPHGADAGQVSNVPLRVVSTAAPEFNQRMQRAWSAVSEQPLEITPVAAETLSEQADRTDVILFQSSQMGQLQAADRLTPLPDSFLQSPGVQSESFLPGLLHGSMKWGDTVYALPLGTAVPAVWVAAGLETPDELTWQGYADLLASVPAGEAAEPLAEGWAAEALLNRAATQTSATWLFDRNTLQPVITDAPYVRALEQLVAARQSYPESLLTPEQVWQQLAAGELQIAVGWPAAGSGAEASPTAPLAMLPYPSAKEVFIDGWQSASATVPPPALHSRGLLVGIAASCRQTAAARAFMTWLASREGHAAVRTASAVIAPHRTRAAAENLAEMPLATDGNMAGGAYDNYVVERLGDGQVRPGLRLPGADDYLAVLDQEVRRALAGELPPAEALAAAAAQWESITERLGRQKQLHAWRESQGLRGG